MDSLYIRWKKSQTTTWYVWNHQKYWEKVTNLNWWVYQISEPAINMSLLWATVDFTNLLSGESTPAAIESSGEQCNADDHFNLRCSRRYFTTSSLGLEKRHNRFWGEVFCCGRWWSGCFSVLFFSLKEHGWYWLGDIWMAGDQREESKNVGCKWVSGFFSDSV